jgi:hypothetical protein
MTAMYSSLEYCVDTARLNYISYTQRFGIYLYSRFQVIGRHYTGGVDLVLDVLA